MKKKSVITVGICIILFAITYWFFFVDTEHLPTGTLIASFPSPDAVYTVNVYECRGNATSADSLRAEVITNDGTRNIYWQYDDSLRSVEWISENVVSINGIHLDVLSDMYDWRR